MLGATGHPILGKGGKGGLSRTPAPTRETIPLNKSGKGEPFEKRLPLFIQGSAELVEEGAVALPGAEVEGDGGFLVGKGNADAVQRVPEAKHSEIGGKAGDAAARRQRDREDLLQG